MPHQCLQGKSSGTDCPILHTLEPGPCPLTGQGTQARATCSFYIVRNGRNCAAFITVADTAMVVLGVLAAVWFFPLVLYPTKQSGQLEPTGKAFLFSQLITQQVRGL